jgi:hypothetical protein
MSLISRVLGPIKQLGTGTPGSKSVGGHNLAQNLNVIPAQTAIVIDTTLGMHVHLDLAALTNDLDIDVTGMLAGDRVVVHCFNIPAGLKILPVDGIVPFYDETRTRITAAELPGDKTDLLYLFTRIHVDNPPVLKTFILAITDLYGRTAYVS